MFEENLHEFVKDFGSPIIFELKNGDIIDTYDGVNPLLGIFDNAFFSAELKEIDLNTTQPRLTMVESDISNIKEGDFAIVENKKYKILKPAQPDGTGMAVLILVKQNGY